MQKKDDNNLMLLIPISGFIIISSKLSPYLELRYIMGILPIISLIFWISVDYILKYYKKQCISVMSIMFINGNNKFPVYYAHTSLKISLVLL